MSNEQTATPPAQDEVPASPSTFSAVDTFTPGSVEPKLKPNQPEHPVVGTRLGNYELTKLIGAGATSVVYKGRHRKLKIPVAVKVLRASALAGSAKLLSKLVSEAVLLARLNHPHVVRLWDLEDEGPHPYLVLEYVDGMSMAEFLARKNAPISTPFAVAFIRQAVEGLAQANAVGIVHRDVKPGNLLLGHDGTVKVADLGLAVVVGEWLSRTSGPGSIETAPAGTAAYLAPEQAYAPTTVDFRADVYSLGCTLYHAATGRLPFSGRSTMEVILKHLNEPPVPPHELVSSISRDLSGLILRMMAKKPEKRVSNYEELRTELGRVVGDRRVPRPLAHSFLAFANQ
jgi:eukaryotic-like serine/threonine-protein kinase